MENAAILASGIGRPSKQADSREPIVPTTKYFRIKNINLLQKDITLKS